MEKKISEVKSEISKIKQRFIDALTDVANQCDTPIEITINARAHNNNFYRQGQVHPFDLIGKESECNTITRPFVLGSQSVNASQLLALEHESICI